MFSTKQKFLFFFFVSLLMIVTPLTQAEAYSTGIQNVDQFREESIDVYQLITINYTTIGDGGSHIGIIKNSGGLVKTMRIHNSLSDYFGQLGGSLRTQSSGDLGSDERKEIIPTAQFIYGENRQEITQWEYGIYDETQFNKVETQFNGTQKWLDITEYWTGENETVIIDPAEYSGVKYTTVLVDPNSLALDWCRKNGAELNSVDSINTSIIGNEKLIDMLVIQQSEPVEPDDNLDDGYDVTPISAGQCGWEIVALGMLIFLALVGTAVLISALNGNPILDFSTTVTYSADQTVNINWSTPEINQTELYQDYLDFCGLLGQTPTVEGYYEWSRNYYQNLESLGPDIPNLNMNNNWSTDIDKKDNVLSTIIGFISDLLPIIIAIVIIIAFIFGFLWIYRTAKKLTSPTA